MAPLHLQEGTCPGPPGASRVKYAASHGGVGAGAGVLSVHSPSYSLLVAHTALEPTFLFSSLSLENSNFTTGNPGDLASPGYEEHTGVSSQTADMFANRCSAVAQQLHVAMSEPAEKLERKQS